jgi:hypothetical protein
MMMSHNGDGFAVTIPKATILERLKANLEKHKTVLKETAENYDSVRISAIEKALAMAKEGKDPKHALIAAAQLSKPASHVREYQVAIGMLENSTTTELIMDSTMYRQYMDDEWDWKRGFIGAAMSYSATAASDHASDE